MKKADVNIFNPTNKKLNENILRPIKVKLYILLFELTNTFTKNGAKTNDVVKIIKEEIKINLLEYLNVSFSLSEFLAP
ncbi:protein of unknown function [Tepidibacter aestuarii]|nr:protein of unknown function [Tepidibacter aestuarii]